AEVHYRQALARAEELEMRPLVAHCKLGLGMLCRKLGREDEARAELQAAAEMYRSMEMTFWVERAEAAPAAVGCPNPPILPGRGRPGDARRGTLQYSAFRRVAPYGGRASASRQLVVLPDGGRRDRVGGAAA